MSVNKVTLVGNLGRDPELTHTNSGMAVCNVSLATSESWTDKNGQRQEKTEWHRLTIWGRRGESVAKHLSKGRQVYVEGKIQTREWQDSDGNKRYTTEVVCNNVVFLGSNPDSRPAAKNGGDPGPQEPVGAASGFSDDEVPFS